ncbi:hypothetical protein D9M68_893080 [compost metagenome]
MQYGIFITVIDIDGKTQVHIDHTVTVNVSICIIKLYCRAYECTGAGLRMAVLGHDHPEAYSQDGSPCCKIFHDLAFKKMK